MQKKIHTNGSALLIIIITIILISTLGLAIFSLTGTGALDTVVYNNNKQAYYLAESGYRHAAGLYLNTENKDKDGTADDEKAKILQEKIDGGQYTLPNGGKFSLNVYPYWLMPDHDYIGKTSNASFHFPGQIPEDFGIPNEGVMAYSHTEKDGEKIALFKYSDANISTSNKKITCELGQRLVAGQYCDIKSKDTLFLALPLKKTSSNQTAGLQGGKLTLDISNAKSNRCIPPYNGIFIWGAENKEYLYKKADFKDNNIILSDITTINGKPVGTNFIENITTKPAKGYLVFKRNLTLISKGETGNGELNAVRTINYNIPISNSSSEDKGELERQDIVMKSQKDLITNFKAVQGTIAEFKSYLTTNFQGQQVQSPSATILKINPENNTKIGQVDLRVRKQGSNELTDAQRKLRAAWKKNNHLLEYDVQAKLSSLTKLLYAATGLSIRVSGNGKEFLALSFMSFYTPSIIYEANNNINPAGGTLTGKKNGRKIFSGVRCLGKPQPNHLYRYQNRFLDKYYLVLDERQDEKRIPIHPDDYQQIANSFSKLDGAELILTDSEGIQHTIGTVKYPHLTSKTTLKPYDREKFGPYEWTNYNDFIPRDIKPLKLANQELYMGSMNDWLNNNHNSNYPISSYHFYPGKNEHFGPYSPYNIFQRLALVLWEQYEDSNGQIKRRWLAAKDMTDDKCILGVQESTDGRIVHDDTALLIRVRENEIKGIKTNLIDVFYGDKTNNNKEPNSIPFDKRRKRYDPTTVHWPPISLDDWSEQEDYFTHIQAFIKPDGSLNKKTNWDLLNPDIKKGTGGPEEIAVFEITNSGTLLVSCHPSPIAPLNNQTEFSPEEEAVWQDRPEISFHAVGDIDSSYNKVASMNDFGLRTLISGEEGYLKGGFLPGIQR